jgi:anhydro-N-acetylmuramic acid kinase
MATKLPINIIGVMSGTSLDGVDLAFCSFDEVGNQLNYKILHTKAIDYSTEWKQKLQQLPQASAKEFVATDHEFGRYLGDLIKEFCHETQVMPAAIGSHGHTIFHEPQLGYTSQIGNPNAIYGQCEIPVIADFRSLDVAFGGIGAPLVPIGDQLLFANHICVNLGGIANLSYFKNEKAVAYDVSPFNLLLNEIARQIGQTYDKGGQFASTGEVDSLLFKQLNDVAYYEQYLPKSLDKSWVEQVFFPLINNSVISLADKQRTIIEHLVVQLNQELTKAVTETNQAVLFTGGGTHNSFFIERLKQIACYEIVVPNKEVIDFKEALIFAFLAYRKLTNQYNVIAQVTGATKNVISGVVVSE